MTTEEFAQKLESINDEDLIKLADSILGKLCKTGGRSFTMTVPPSITDTDVVFSQVLKRFENSYIPKNELGVGGVMRWAGINEKPNYGDIILIQQPPEAATLPFVTIYDRDTELLDGDCYAVIKPCA